MSVLQGAAGPRELELLMTRQNALDQAVIASAQNCDFIVLDELHTYRGRFVSPATPRSALP